MELVGFVSLWMAGRVTGGQAGGTSFTTIVGSILSGASAYGRGVSVGLGQSGWRWPRPLPATCQTPTSPRPANHEPSRPVGGRDGAAQAGAGRPGRPRERRGIDFELPDRQELARSDPRDPRRGHTLTVRQYWKDEPVGGNSICLHPRR